MAHFNYIDDVCYTFLQEIYRMQEEKSLILFSLAEKWWRWQNRLKMVEKEYEQKATTIALKAAANE